MIFNRNVRQLPARRQIGLELGRDLRHFKFISLIVLVFFGLSPLTPPRANAAIDTYDDLAIGIPFEAIGDVINAGGVAVFYGNASGLSVVGKFDDQIWSKNEPGVDGTATAGERFGTSLAAGDFNGDGHLDLAIGVPYETVGGAANAGTVYILYGGPVGLTTLGSQVWSGNSPGLGNSAQVGDVFGFALAAGDFNHDGFVDLAIGINGKDVGAATSAGMVQILYGSSAGLAANGSQIWNQNSPGIEGVAEIDDRFGYALAAGDFNGDGFVDLAIGVPFEDVGGVASAGAMNIIFGSASGLTSTGNQIWHESLIPPLASENSAFFGWALTAGDFNGDGKSDLAISIHGKDLGGSDRGAVAILYGTATGLTDADSDFINQGIAGILGIAEDGDFFGQALTAGDFNGDGFYDLAIGAPLDRASGVNSGAVNVLYGTAAGVSALGDQLWHKGNLTNGTTAAAGDHFGRVLATGDFNGDGFADLAIGVILEKVGGAAEAGAIYVVYGSAGKLTSNGHQYFTQSSFGVRGAAESGDRFGSALAAGKFGKPEGLIFMPLILRDH